MSDELERTPVPTSNPFTTDLLQQFKPNQTTEVNQLN